MDKKQSNKNVVKFNRWGYIFLIPFFVTYVIFSFIPLCSTIYNSFFENYRSGLKQIGPNFVGLANYGNLLGTPEIWKYSSYRDSSFTGILVFRSFPQT